MPIVDGQYQAKISTVFVSVEEGVRQIKDKINASRKVRISNVPVGLLDKLLPALEGKDVKIVLPGDAKPTDQMKKVGDVAIQKAKIYKDYKGTQADIGSVYFSDVIFSVAWTDGKVLFIEALHYDKCVKCMRKFFDVGWHYAVKTTKVKRKS